MGSMLYRLIDRRQDVIIRKGEKYVLQTSSINNANFKMTIEVHVAGFLSRVYDSFFFFF